MSTVILLLFTMMALANPTSSEASDPDSETATGGSQETAPTETVEEADSSKAPSLLAKPQNEEPADDLSLSTEQIEFPLLFSGVDQQIAITRAAASTKKPNESFVPQTFTDITYGKSSFVIGAESLRSCSGGPISMSRLRMLSQKAENELSYYQLEKAKIHLSAAVDGIVCLQDTIDVETVTRIYYLSGVLQQAINNDSLAREHFSVAISLQPNLQWDNYFAPDALPLFEDAQKAFASSEETILNIIPNRMRTNIWVNGLPLTEGEEAVVHTGLNFIQILGRTTETYILSVGEDATDLTLVVPSGIPNTANTWVNDEIQRAELDTLLPQVLETDSTIYIHNNGEIWETTVGSTDWKQLEVPRWANNSARFSKEQFGKGLFWSGVGLTTVCGGISAIKYIQASSYVNSAGQAEEFPVYDENRTKYNDISDTYVYWASSTVAALGITGIGLFLQF